jgi:hypothetical protein
VTSKATGSKLAKAVRKGGKRQLEFFCANDKGAGDLVTLAGGRQAKFVGLTKDTANR